MSASWKKTEMVFDGSWEGFLSLIFQSYAQRAEPTGVGAGEQEASLFGPSLRIETRPEEGKRIAKAVRTRASKAAYKMAYRCFLSEDAQAHRDLYRWFRTLFDEGPEALGDYRRDYLLRLRKTHKMMRRELHRMHAFVRFERLEDGLFASVVEPDFNVLPLIGSHFKKRYADQEWLIYDLRRDYGIRFDRSNVETVSLDAQAVALLQKEGGWQEMWRSYFRSVNIPERRNLKLHLRHVPLRYWKYLPEKQ